MFDRDETEMILARLESHVEELRDSVDAGCIGEQLHEDIFDIIKVLDLFKGGTGYDNDAHAAVLRRRGRAKAAEIALKNELETLDLAHGIDPLYDLLND